MPSAARALPAGARLDGFEIEALIFEGSVSIVYWATDRALAIPVAIAEYMPARLALRIDESQVTPRTSSQADTFAKGLKAFISETRILARCNHPSLVRIVRLFEANATAYRVMPRYPAKRLLDVRPGMNEPPDEEAVRALLDALLGALQAFHLAGGVHGRVAPSNILLLADNAPLLLGPGAAGRAIAGDPIDALKTSEEPCFAPIEQLVEADTPLPPSVDLYALAGVARYWISGELPPPAFGTSSTARRETLADTVQRLRLTWPRLHYSASLLDALDSALSIYPAQRPQSVAQMRARLGSAPQAASGPVSAESTAAPVPDDVVPSSPPPAPEPAPADHVAEELDGVMAFAPAPDPQANSDVARVDDDLPVQTTFARQEPNPRRIAMWSGAVLVLLALLAVGAYQFRQEPQVGRVLDVLGINLGTGAGEYRGRARARRRPCGTAGDTADCRGRRSREAGADGAQCCGLTDGRQPSLRLLPAPPNLRQLPARLPRTPETSRRCRRSQLRRTLRRSRAAARSRAAPSARGAAPRPARSGQPARGLR